MFGSTVLEVAIGMAFVFLSVSLICSGVGSKISEWLGSRAKHLENNIRDLLMNGDPALVDRIYGSELIKSLAPPGQKPINIPAKTFALAVFDVFVPGASGMTTVGELHKAITGMSDSPMKNKLLTLVNNAETSVNAARENVENWYNAAEDRMTSTYHQHMWSFAVVIGLCVSIFFNVDSVAIGATLWKDPAVRSALASTATEYAKQSADNPNDSVKRDNAVKAIDDLNKLNLPIGWQLTVRPTFSLVPNDWAKSGQPIGGVAYLLKLVGWIITGLAGAQGAPFWFDLLKKLTQRN
jgi:hypothetical protein